MKTPSDLRENYGSVYVTELNDGTIIPWVPLSIGEHLDYHSIIKRNLVSLSVIENEIWNKCVVDSYLRDNAYKLKAGTVSTVVHKILELSGPSTVEHFNLLMDINRQKVNSEPFYQVVSVICRAFPSYTPDELLAMDSETFFLRLAQAEYKLMDSGLLQEPIYLFNPKDEKEEKKPKFDPQKLREAFQEQNKPKESPQERIRKARESGQKNIQLSQEKEVIYEDFGSTVEGETFKVPIDMLVRGMDEVVDSRLLKEFKEDIKHIYPDYLKMGSKVKIKSVEERIEEAKARAEANKKKLYKPKKNK